MAKRDNPPERHRRRLRMRWGRLIGFLVFVGVVIPVLGLAWSGFRLKQEASALKTDYHAHDYAALASSIQRLGGTLGMMRTEAVLLSWLNIVPGVRGYYQNGMDLLTAGHLDLHAFGQVLPPVLTAAESPGTAAQRKARVSQAVSQAGLLMQQLTPQIRAANASVQHMNPAAWPGLLSNKGLSVTALQSLSDTLVRMLPTMSGPHPILATILGLPNPTRYLLIFQNSGELRATGGFMTAYAYVPFHNGKLGKITSQNIQNLDTAVTYHPPAPPIIGAYLPVKYWHLRDANTSPDVPQTVSNIYMLYRSIPNAPKVNGVMFLDTWFVDSLIADVGGLNVPTIKGKTIHLTAQNANYEMEYMAEGMGLPSNLRKLFIGTMMKELMHEVLHGHTSGLIKVAASLRQALDNKHVLLYFNNPAAERFFAQQGWGGVVPRHVNGNYIQVVDENLLGHKDNYYVRESYDVNVRTVGGRQLETVTIHWVDPAVVNWWLTVPYHSWIRVYVPINAQFISMTGVDSYVDDTANTTLNKQEFGGHVDLPGRMNRSQPPSRGKVVVKFWLPSGVNVNRLYLQKQPGFLPEPVTVTVHGVTKHITLTSNQWLTF